MLDEIIRELEEGHADFNPFRYLKITNQLLSNPIQQSEGRELVIRALAEKEKFKDYIKILRSMVRKSGLYPYLKSEFHELGIDDKLAMEFYKSPKSENFIFHSMQLRIYNLLINGDSVVLSAPTSMGKSAIVDSLIASGKFNTIVIVVPTIALIDETRRRISKSFSDDFQIIYHSAQESSSSRRIFILTQERVNERDDLTSVDIFVIDEFYKLSFKSKDDKCIHDERVISLNVALSKLLSVSKQFYMIGPNIDFIRGLENLKNDYIFLSSDFNTVALNIYNYDIKPNDVNNKDSVIKEIIKDNTGQFIIYCKSPKVAEHISSELINSNISFENDECEYTDWLSQYYSPYWQYVKSIRKGIGIHYGTLPRTIQQYTMELFSEKKIKILICTSTIIEGVNTNAEHVIIYDNRDGVSSIDRFTHNNIKGRAGRMTKYFIGNVYCLEVPPQKTINDNVVDIPIGLQNELTPLNLIAGIEPEHIDKSSEIRLDDYLDSNQIPREVIKKHPGYDIEVIRKLFSYFRSLENCDLKLMSFKRFPEKYAMDIISTGLLTTSMNTLRRNNISFEVESISGLLYSYLNAKSHQDYFDFQLKRIYSRQGVSDESAISEAINRELKILRNVLSYTVPKSLSLQQDIITHVAESRGLEINFDFSYMINTFEKFHLPGNVAALEEMGVPVQSLQKIKFPEDVVMDINKSIDYIKNIYLNCNLFSTIEKKLIHKALMF